MLNLNTAAGEREPPEERDRSDAAGSGALCRCSSMKYEKSVEPSFNVAQKFIPSDAEAYQKGEILNEGIERGVKEWDRRSRNAQI